MLMSLAVCVFVGVCVYVCLSVCLFVCLRISVFRSLCCFLVANIGGCKCVFCGVAAANPKNDCFGEDPRTSLGFV